MGSVGTQTASKYPQFPQNTRYFHYKNDRTGDNVYYFEDADIQPKDRLEKDWKALSEGYKIEEFYDVHTHYSTGRSGSTKYWVVRYGNETIKYLGTLKEAKEYLEGRKWEA